MKAIIVDDEPRAIDLLKGYLAHFSGIELVGCFRNGLKAFEFITKSKVDIIFLDISMPHITGITLAKMVPAGTRIIFTTAHAEHAVESYELQVVDYLLKPVSLDRFTMAISKLLAQSTLPEKQNAEWVLIKSGLETFRVKPNDILYLEKAGNNMMYHCIQGKILSRESIKESLNKLPVWFLQTQKSFIVNTQKITSFEKNVVKVGEVSIPLSDAHKEALFLSIGSG